MNPTPLWLASLFWTIAAAIGSPRPIVDTPSAGLPQEAPATDLYLAEISSADGRLTVSTPTNLTERDGYDNQPFFTADGRRLLYTSIRDGQADTYAVELGSRRIWSLIRTRESEYSPTPIPGETRFSVVRVESDSAQRLWSFADDGSDPKLLLPGLEPVGYHAWGDASTVAVFVLGDPPSLHLVNVRSGDRKRVADGVGRSLHRIPGRRAISFVRKRAADAWWIEQLDLETGETRQLLRTRPGREDHAWLPDGSLLMGDGPRLYRAEPWTESPEWRLVADFAEAGLAEITRLAVAPDGDQLALVAVPADRADPGGAAGTGEREAAP